MVAPKTISMPVVHSVQTVRPSCAEINTLKTDRNELPHDPHHLGVPSSAYKIITEPMVRSVPTMHLSCVEFLYDPRPSI
jgi:hypothetical protein